MKVNFTDGASGDYDLIVGADGTHSRVRSAVFGDENKPNFTGQGVWRDNVRRPAGLDRAILCAGLRGGNCGAFHKHARFTRRAG